MKNLIKENVLNFFIDKRKWIIFVIFAWFCGDELVLAQAVDMSVFEYLLFVMGNHYYIIYFLLMSFLLFQFEQSKRSSDYVTIRIKSIKNKYIVQTLSILIQSAIYILLHFIVAFFIGVTKLEIANKFQTVSIDGYYNDTLNFVYGFNHFFANPMSAILAIGIYMTIGLSLIGVAIYAINEIKGSKITLVFIGILILDIMLGFKLNIHEVPGLLFANNYFILHHVLFRSGKEWAIVTMGVTLLLFYGLYYLIKKYKGNGFTRYNYIKHMFVSSYKFSISFLIFYVLLNSFSVYLQEQKFCPMDGIISNLLGYSIQNFEMIEFIKHVIFFFIPLFFIGSLLEKEKQMYNDQVKIRYVSKKEWNRLMGRNVTAYILIYALVFEGLMIFLYIAGTFLRGNEDVYLKELLEYVGITQEDFLKVVLMSCSLKVLELIYYKDILNLFTDIFHNRIVAYLLTLSGFWVSFAVKGPVSSYGKSSLYYLCDGANQYGIKKLSFLLFGIIISKIVIVRLIVEWRENKWILQLRFKMEVKHLVKKVFIKI